MKYYSLVSFFLIIIFFSCSTRETIDRNCQSIKYIELHDLSLIPLIIDYYDSNLDEMGSNYALILDFQYRNDTSFMDIYYEKNLVSIHENTPPYYTFVCGNVVFIRMKPQKIIDKSGDCIDSLLKIVFPKQYDYYIKYGEYLPPTTYSCEKRTYTNNFLIDMGRY